MRRGTRLHAVAAVAASQWVHHPLNHEVPFTGRLRELAVSTGRPHAMFADQRNYDRTSIEAALQRRNRRISHPRRAKRQVAAAAPSARRRHACEFCQSKQLAYQCHQCQSYLCADCVINADVTHRDHTIRALRAGQAEGQVRQAGQAEGLHAHEAPSPVYEPGAPQAEDPVNAPTHVSDAATQCCSGCEESLSSRRFDCQDCDERFCVECRPLHFPDHRLVETVDRDGPEGGKGSANGNDPGLVLVDADAEVGLQDLGGDDSHDGYDGRDGDDADLDVEIDQHTDLDVEVDQDDLHEHIDLDIDLNEPEGTIDISCQRSDRSGLASSFPVWRDELETLLTDVITKAAVKAATEASIIAIPRILDHLAQRDLQRLPARPMSGASSLGRVPRSGLSAPVSSAPASSEPASEATSTPRSKRVHRELLDFDVDPDAYVSDIPSPARRRAAPRRQWTTEDKQQLEALMGRGLAANKIASTMRRTIGAVVQQWRKQAGD